MRKVIYDGYRRYLPPGSRARRQKFRYRGVTYYFKKREWSVAPRIRNNAFVSEACTVAVQSGQPFLGHKWMPLNSSWPGFDWWRVNCPDIMHDEKNLVESLLLVIVGNIGDGFYATWKNDSRHRAECQIHGV